VCGLGEAHAGTQVLAEPCPPGRGMLRCSDMGMPLHWAEPCRLARHTPDPSFGEAKE